MVVGEIILPGLRAIAGNTGRTLLFVIVVVLVIMVAKVLCGLALLVPATVDHRRPGNLEWQQAQHDEHKNTSHGSQYRYYEVALSITGRPNSIVSLHICEENRLIVSDSALL